MECFKCKTKLITKDLIHTKIIYCDNCYEEYHTVETNKCCVNPQKSIVKTIMKDGRIALNNQCNCGIIEINYLKYKENKNLNLEEIKLKDQEIHIQRKAQIIKEVSEFLQYIHEQITKMDRKQQSNKIIIGTEPEGDE